MQEEKYTIIYYEKADGTCPAEEFLLNLDNKMAAKIMGLLEVLEEKGNYLREPYSKYIGDGIFELRAKMSTNITRIMYFFYIDKKIILTNGFVKKTQKTPRKEVDLAKRYRADFLQRMEEQNEDIS